ncbi:MAG: molybdate ABC transporter permease subunit [Spirochaetaceae bacterium]|nr:molybdate ABC transporter permease subunit [Spirochaetaceae bacterium]
MDLVILRETVFLSLKIGLLATLFNLPAALAGAYFLDRVLVRNRSIIEGIINLPLVMPPVTTGYLLLILLGKRGLFGSFLYRITGYSIAYSWTAAVLASMVVSFPLLIRSIRTSLDMVDRRFEYAAMTLGAGRFDLFVRVSLPLIIPGIINGLVLGFARSLGEFGATVTFAGNIQGETRTIPLSVYSLLQIPGKENEAGLLVLISIVISFGALFLSSIINGRVHHGSGI